MKHLLLLFIILSGSLSSAQGISIDQPVFEESFESYTPGVLPAGGIWSEVDPDALKTKRKIEVVTDSGDLMGEGTANQMLYFYNIASDPVAYDTLITANGLSTGNVLQVEFDFYETSAVAGGLKILVGGDPGAAQPVNSFTLIDGSIGPSGSYSLNAPHRLVAVFNESGSVLEYDDPAGGASSLQTGFMDIWIDQVRVTAGVTQSRDASPSSQLSSIRFINAGTQQEIYLDHIGIYEVSAVVEPPPPSELTITNFVADGQQVLLEWDNPVERHIVIGGDRLADLSSDGWCFSSASSPTNSAVFAYDAPAGFFMIKSGIAAINSVSSPALVDEVKAQSSVAAPTNRIYDVELDAIYGMTLQASGFSLSELSDFSSLDKLSLSGSELTALGDLSPLIGITWLNLSDNQLSDLSGLGILGSLEALNLESNLVVNLNGLEGLSHLRWLDLEHNGITDLSLLVTNAANGGLGEGDELWIRGNPLSASATNQIESLENDFNVKVHY